MSSHTLTVGILGGLGPEATLDFFAKVLAATPARSDQDHLHLIIENNPAVPDRHAALRGQGEDPTPTLVTMARNLERSGADFVVMVCNTAHAYQAAIAAALSIPFIGLIDEVVGYIERTHAAPRKIGLMAADGCLQANLYQQALVHAGFCPVLWTDQELAAFMALVYRIKAEAGSKGANAEIASALKDLTRPLLQRGAEVLLAACTEIPLFLSQDDFRTPECSCLFLSSTDILVQRTVAYAIREIPLPAYESKGDT